MTYLFPHSPLCCASYCLSLLQHIILCKFCRYYKHAPLILTPIMCEGQTSMVLNICIHCVAIVCRSDIHFRRQPRVRRTFRRIRHLCRKLWWIVHIPVSNQLSVCEGQTSMVLNICTHCFCDRVQERSSFPSSASCPPHFSPYTALLSSGSRDSRRSSPERLLHKEAVLTRLHGQCALFTVDRCENIA